MLADIRFKYHRDPFVLIQLLRLAGLVLDLLFRLQTSLDGPSVAIGADFCVLDNYARVLLDSCGPSWVVLVHSPQLIPACLQNVVFINFGTHEITETVSSRVDGLLVKSLFVGVDFLPALGLVQSWNLLERSVDPPGGPTTYFAAASARFTAQVALGDHHPVISAASAKA